MSVLVLGTTALDSIKTPQRENPRLLGGSASHAAVAASFVAPVGLVGVVGTDFPSACWRLYERHGIDLRGLQRMDGKTFHWAGEYMADMNQRRTLKTELGVLEKFSPVLPPDYRATPYVLLANISPALQLQVLEQMRRPRFVVADTMDLWINIALQDLLKLLKRIDALVLNDSEAQSLTKTDNLRIALERIHRMGPRWVIIKKGSHGSMLSGPDGLFLAPAYPLHKVVDPTGAGDSFVGGLVGWLASNKGGVARNIRRAVIFGSVVASFCCEGFGLQRTDRLTLSEIEKRMSELERMCRF